MSNNCVLIVAAHPDDELLGCGGTIAKHVAEGDEVHIVILADGVTSRGENTELYERKKSAIKAAEFLGVKSIKMLDFPDNQLDTVPLLKIVSQIEINIENLKPSTVYTHHDGDLNIDHIIAARAVMTACRPVLGQCVHSIYGFEIPSSTEWGGYGQEKVFIPKYFINISDYLDKKLEALQFYSQELREFPHPRSIYNIKALIRLRGAQVGLKAVEAFSVLRQVKI